jgi:hypothetical protein
MRHHLKIIPTNNLSTLSSLISPVPLTQPSQRLIGRKLEWKILGGMRMAKQLDCTTRIESTQNDEIHGVHFGPHITFSRLSHLACKLKPGFINISGVDWITSKSTHSIQ